MGSLWLTRVSVFAALVLFSVIELGLAAGFIAKLHNFDGFTFSAPAYSVLALTIAILTLFTLGPMVVIDFLRRGALTSWVMVELIVTGILMILWLATAADTAAATLGESVDCNFVGEESSDASMICHTYQAIEAFAFINWILLIVYFGVLLTYALIAHARGNSPWRGTVRDTDFAATGMGGAQFASVPMTQQGTGNTYSPVPT